MHANAIQNQTSINSPGTNKLPWQHCDIVSLTLFALSSYAYTMDVISLTLLPSFIFELLKYTWIVKFLFDIMNTPTSNNIKWEDNLKQLLFNSVQFLAPKRARGSAAKAMGSASERALGTWHIVSMVILGTMGMFSVKIIVGGCPGADITSRSLFWTSEKSHVIILRFISFSMFPYFFKHLTQPEAALGSVRHHGFGFSGIGFFLAVGARSRPSLTFQP